MSYLRPNEERAKYATALISIILLLDVISVWSGFLQYNLLKSVADGLEITSQEAETNDNRETIIGFVYIIFYIISAITFLQWFRRAYFNLHLRLKGLSQKENWATISWFIPVVSLYVPYQIMKELYSKTRKLLVEHQLIREGELTTNVLGVWWGLWVISNILGQITFRLADSETVEGLINYTVLSVVNNILGVPLAILALKVVRDYSNVESLLREIKEPAVEE